MYRIKKISSITLIIIIGSIAFYGFKPQKKSEIIEISNSSKCGDKGGRFFSKIVRKDSTFIVSGNRLSNTVSKKYLTDSIKWNELINLLNIEDFKKIKSEKIKNNVMMHDGCISTYTLKTNDSIFIKSISHFPAEMIGVGALYNKM